MQLHKKLVRGVPCRYIRAARKKYKIVNRSTKNKLTLVGTDL